MTHSYKKEPIGGVASSACQKKFRSQENRRKRRKIKTLLQQEKYDLMPHEKEYGNEWSSPRDGTQYWLDSDDKRMRK